MRRTAKRTLSRVLAAALLVSAVFSMGAQPSRAVHYEGSETYMAGKYYQALQQVKLTGNARTDIVNVALSQVGYLEGTYFDELSGEICGYLNATEYGEWYGMQDQWCAIFTSWCAAVAGISEEVVPKHSYTPIGLQWFRSRGRAYSRERVVAGAYTPQPGDLIYFKSGSTLNPTNHVGLVTDYRDGIVYTIEGNTSSPSIFSSGGTVASKSYPITNTYIVYICSPDYELTGLRVAEDDYVRTAEEKLDALCRVIGALETGGLGNYEAIGQSYDGCVTLGCGQWYANDAKELLLRIFDADPEAFGRLDTAGIAADLQAQNWQEYRLDLNSEKAGCIAAILGSDAGIQTQKQMLKENLQKCQAEAAALGVANEDARLACAVVRYMGGKAALRQVLNRVQENGSVESICTAMGELGYVGAELVRDALS